MVRGPQHVLGCEWAGGFAHLANGHNKMGFPNKITSYEDSLGKHRVKRKETGIYFLLACEYMLL